MPSHETLNPVSAFTVYQRSQQSNAIKKKKKKVKKTKEKTQIIENGVKNTHSQTKSKKSKKVNKKSKDVTTHKPLSELKPTEVVEDKNDNISEEEADETPPQLIPIDENDIPIPHVIDLPHNDNPIEEAKTLFKWLISPLAPNKFLFKYWEQRPVHIKRNKPTFYSHILNSAQFDKIIRNNSLEYDKNIDVVAYENNKKEVFNQQGRVTASALWDYYANGCSIRLLNPQTYSYKVHLLLTTLQEFFGSMVGANVYLTPPGSQGFAPHYDDIEAFVVQLEGRKHWKLYEPKDSEMLARFSSNNLNHEDIGEPFMALTLQAGEILYFPRGIIHEGRTDPDAHSLHMTISVYQRTAYVDLLEHLLPEALAKAAQNEIDFRRGLPRNYLRKLKSSQRTRYAITKTVKVLVEKMMDFIDVDSAAKQLGRKFMRDSMPPVMSRFESIRSVKADGPYLEDGKVVNRIELSPDTKIRLLRYYCLNICWENRVPKMYYNTENAMSYHGGDEQWLELDPVMVPAIEMLQKQYPQYVAIEDLPLEDVLMKMQLISDLWEHGLVITEQPLDPIDSDLDFVEEEEEEEHGMVQAEELDCIDDEDIDFLEEEDDDDDTDEDI